MDTSFFVRKTSVKIHWSHLEQIQPIAVIRSKIIMTSIFQQSEIISSRYFVTVVNQYRCYFVILFMFNYL